MQGGSARLHLRLGELKSCGFPHNRHLFGAPLEGHQEIALGNAGSLEHAQFLDHTFAQCADIDGVGRGLDPTRRLQSAIDARGRPLRSDDGNRRNADSR